MTTDILDSGILAESFLSHLFMCMNANIIKMQIVHKMKYNLGGHWRLLLLFIQRSPHLRNIVCLKSNLIKTMYEWYFQTLWLHHHLRSNGQPLSLILLNFPLIKKFLYKKEKKILKEMVLLKTRVVIYE